MIWGIVGGIYEQVYGGGEKVAHRGLRGLWKRFWVVEAKAMLGLVDR